MTEVLATAVINNPQAPFSFEGEWPSWAITHFLPLYDPDIDSQLHNAEFPAAEFTEVISSGLKFEQIKGQRLYNLQPQTSSVNGVNKTVVPVWKYYNSDGKFWDKPFANDSNNDLINGLYMPASSTSGATFIQNITQPSFTPYNVVEWYDKETSAYVTTTIPGLEPLSEDAPVTSWAYLPQDSGIINIFMGDATYDPPIPSEIQAISIKSEDSFDSYSVTISYDQLDTQQKRDMAYSSVSYTGSVSDTRETEYECTSSIQGQFNFLVRPNLGNFRFNKILFFLSMTPTESYSNPQHLMRPIFFGHLGFTNAETVGRTRVYGKSITGVIDQINIIARLAFAHNLENAPTTVINVNDWQQVMSSSIAYPGLNNDHEWDGRFRTVYAVGHNPFFSFEKDVDIAGDPIWVEDSSLSPTSRTYTEDISNHYASQVYPGDIAIGQVDSKNGNNEWANGGLPSMVTPRAKVHIAQTSMSYSSTNTNLEDIYTYVNTYFPHIRLSDKTFMSGIDFRFFDILKMNDPPICFEEQTIPNRIRLPHKGMLAINASFGYIGGMGIAVGQNAIADAEVLEEDFERNTAWWFSPRFRANNFATAMGLGSRAVKGANSFALGEYAQVFKPNSFALGRGAAVVDTDLGYAIGPGAITSTYDSLQFAKKYGNRIPVLPHTEIVQSEMYHGSFVYGQDSLADNGVAIGYYTSALGRIGTVRNDGITSYTVDSDEEIECIHGHTCGCCACIRLNPLLVSRNTDASVLYEGTPGYSVDGSPRYKEYHALAIGLRSTAIARAMAIGTWSQAMFHDSMAIGTSAYVNTRQCVVIGHYVNVGSATSNAAPAGDIINIGVSNNISLTAATQFGSAATIAVNGYTSLRTAILGFQINASGAALCIGLGSSLNFSNRSNLIGIGTASALNGDNSISIGNQSHVRSNNQIIIGTNATDTQSKARIISIGNNLRSYGYRSILIGNNLSSLNGEPTGDNLEDETILIGASLYVSQRQRMSGTATVPGRVLSLGQANYLADQSIAIGTWNTTYGFNSIAIGRSNLINFISSTAFPHISNANNIAIGIGNKIQGAFSVAIGNENIINGFQNSDISNILVGGFAIGHKNISTTRFMWYTLNNNTFSNSGFSTTWSDYMQMLNGQEINQIELLPTIALGYHLDSSYCACVIGHSNRLLTDLYNINNANWSRRIDSRFIVGGGNYANSTRLNLIEIGIDLLDSSKLLYIFGDNDAITLPTYSDWQLGEVMKNAIFVGPDGLLRYNNENIAPNMLEPITVYSNGNCAILPEE